MRADVARVAEAIAIAIKLRGIEGHRAQVAPRGYAIALRVEVEPGEAVERRASLLSAREQGCDGFGASLTRGPASVIEQPPLIPPGAGLGGEPALSNAGHQPVRQAIDV